MKHKTSAPKTGIHSGVLQLSAVKPGKNLSRLEIDQKSQAFVELKDSIAKHGLLQNLVVGPADKEGNHELLAGYRRYLALTQLGIRTAPATIMDDADPATINLVENVQRENLSPVELAQAYERLAKAKKWEGHGRLQKIATAVGVSRPMVSKIIDLLKLPTSVQKQVHEGALDPTAARLVALLDNEQEQEALVSAAKKISKERAEGATKKTASGKERKQRVTKKSKASGKPVPADRVQEGDVRQAAKKLKESGVKSPKLDKIAPKAATIPELITMCDGVMVGDKRLEKLGKAIKDRICLKLTDRQFLAAVIEILG